MFEIKDQDVITIINNLEIQYYRVNKKYIYEDSMIAIILKKHKINNVLGLKANRSALSIKV